MKDAPLSCEIENGELVIRIGIDVLSLATEDREPFTIYDEKIGGFRKAWIVTDPLEFARDVRIAITDEEEDGSSPLTNLLDLACANALDQGSLGVEEAKVSPETEEDDGDDE
jgi:hypothetical protein